MFRELIKQEQDFKGKNPEHGLKRNKDLPPQIQEIIASLPVALQTEIMSRYIEREDIDDQEQNDLNFLDMLKKRKNKMT